jgi:hypothetical protein
MLQITIVIELLLEILLYGLSLFVNVVVISCSLLFHRLSQLIFDLELLLINLVIDHIFPEKRNMLINIHRLLHESAVLVLDLLLLQIDLGLKAFFDVVLVLLVSILLVFLMSVYLMVEVLVLAVHLFLELLMNSLSCCKDSRVLLAS